MEDLSRRYREFARDQARGRSDAYARLTEAIADDDAVLALVARMPTYNKRQPNLLLAAVRHLGGPCGEDTRYADFRAFVTERWDDVSAVMLARATQTNEPRRCATLLPLLASLPGPLALLEVGASAGLCLHPDRYRYRYDDRPEIGPADSPAVLTCATSGPVPLPDAVPEVVWRAGIDLNPLDLEDEDDRGWLESLVWPGDPERERGLRAAAEAVRGTRTRIVRGDLLEALPDVAAGAPRDATLVVFHTSVLGYVPLEARERFARLVRALPGHWVSSENAEVLPWLEGPVPGDPYLHVLALDERPVAFAAPHGQTLRWLGE